MSSILPSISVGAVRGKPTRTYTGVTAQTFNYTYTYDGLRQTMVNSGGTWSYSYDQLGRYTSMSSPLGTVTSAWDLNSRQTQRTLPSGAFTTYGYNQLGTITSLVNKQNSSTTLSSFGSFSFDPVFNIKQWTQSVTPPNAGSNASQFAGVTNYEYNGDALGATNKDQLTKETSTRFAAPGSPWTENNVYDPAGNPTTFRNTSGQNFNSNNQKTGSTFAYDGNGNPTNYGGKTATYDNENRLKTFPNPTLGQNWQAGYRADGLRAWTKAGTHIETVYYYYDGGNAVLEKLANGTTVAVNVFAPDGLVARSYSPPPVDVPEGETTPGPEELEAIGTVVGLGYSGEYLFDWQGNATHIFSPDGITIIGGGGGQTTNYLLIHSAYNAWGQKNFLYPANVNMELHRFGYNARWGYRTDTETGLMYCQNRYYDAANGRWLTRDPISYSGGVNLYGYCGGGPVGRMDSAGLLVWFVAVPLYLAGAAAAALLTGYLTATPASAPATPYQVPGGAANERKNIEDTSRDQAIVGAVAFCLGFGGKAFKIYREPVPKAPSTRVGRRMSQREYEAMVAEGRVQNSRANPSNKERTSVTNPPDPNGFTGKPGQGFVSFDVPKENVAQGGNSGWGIVFGSGDSMYGPRVAPGSGMPPASNISPFDKP